MTPENTPDNMSAKTLFLSDLDGTLFNYFHDTDRAILRRLREMLAQWDGTAPEG